MTERTVRMRVRIGYGSLMPGLDGKPRRSESMRDYPDAVFHPGVDEPMTPNHMATSPVLELKRILCSGDSQEYDLEAAKALAKRWKV